jgi:hypothetical protein
VDDEHVLTFIEAVDRTHLDTVHVLTFDTAFIDDVGQLSLLSPLPRAIFVVELMRDHPRSTSLREGMRRVTCVAASVQAAHIHDRGLGPLSLDLQRRNERVFSVNDNSVRVPFDSKSHSELPGHFRLPQS